MRQRNFRELRDQYLNSSNTRQRKPPSMQDSSPESAQIAGPTLGQLPTGTMTRQLRQAAVLRMQQTHGNAAVRRMVTVPHYQEEPLPATGGNGTPGTTATPASQAIANWQASQSLEPQTGEMPSNNTPDMTATPASQAIANWQASQSLEPQTSEMPSNNTPDTTTTPSNLSGGGASGIESFQQNQALPSTADQTPGKLEDEHGF